MDFTDRKTAARRALDPFAWAYFAATADPHENDDQDAAEWARIEIMPRVLSGVEHVDITLTLPRCPPLRSPLALAPTASHGLAHPDAELASARAAADVGALMIYSHSATIGIEEFGAGATGTWWAQAYLLRDRARTQDYLDRAAAAGAQAVVLTVDGATQAGAAPFRSALQERLDAPVGNFPGETWAEMVASYASGLTVDDIADTVGRTRLPVYVKGVLRPDDAVRVVDAGAAGVVVSNHGRRQIAGVVATAHALPQVIDAVAARVPVLVDGGIRSGLDILRALALGASGVAIGRPTLWALATGGAGAITCVLRELTGELRRAMAAAGAGALADITPDLVRAPTW